MNDLFQTNGSSPPRSRFPGLFPGQVAHPVADAPADFLVRNEGTIFLLEPKNDVAVAWVDEHLPADRQLWGASTVVEHRYIRDIVAGIQSAGLAVA